MLPLLELGDSQIIPSQTLAEKSPCQKKYGGLLVLDINGTLTLPKDNEQTDPLVLPVLAEYITGGGTIAFCSLSTMVRIGKTVLFPLLYQLSTPFEPSKIIVLPENGSAILRLSNYCFESNKVVCDWQRSEELPVPDKEQLQQYIIEKLIPKFGGSLADNRQYILSWKGFRNSQATAKMKRVLEAEYCPLAKDISWGQIMIRPSTTTLDFIHVKANKAEAVRRLLSQLEEIEPVLGFGDHGDDFGKVVPTFNVRPGLIDYFALKGIPSMDIDLEMPGYGNSTASIIERLLRLGFFVQVN